MEDLEGKVKSLKDQVKKKEETEKKYQGTEGVGGMSRIGMDLFSGGASGQRNHFFFSPHFAESLAQLNTIAEQQARELATLKV